MRQQYAEEVQACENLNKEYNGAIKEINDLKQQLVENKKDFEDFKEAKELEAETLNKKFEVTVFKRLLFLLKTSKIFHILNQDQFKKLQEELEKKELDVQRAVNDKEDMEKEKDVNLMH